MSRTTPAADTGTADASSSRPVPEWDAVLFDLDDTLLDLRSAQRAAFDTTVRRQWAQVDAVDPCLLEEATHAFAADVGGHYPRYLAGELTFEEQRLARAADALAVLGARDAGAVPHRDLWTQGYEMLVRGHWALLPGTAEVLDGVRRSGRGVGIVTNNMEQYQRGKADALGLEWVRVLIGSDTAGAPKPDPAPFLAGCTALGADPARTLMVGDSLTSDVAGARAAGLIPVWLTGGAARGPGTTTSAHLGVVAETASDAPRWDEVHECWRLATIRGLRGWVAAAGERGTR